MGTFWSFIFINPLETRSHFGWKPCNADLNLQDYPNLGEEKSVMPNDFEIVKLVRANPGTQAIFFTIILNLFRKFACDLSSPTNRYSQDVDANGKPMRFFGPLDFKALRAEESSRMAQHAHGLICSRFFKLYNNIELIDKGSELVMSWMGCIATSVMGRRLVYLSEDSFGALNLTPK